MALSHPITFLGELFDFKGRKRNKQFRNTLLDYEQQHFIESRIPYSLVTELTGLEGDERAMFYNRYLRDYEFVKYASIYDIHLRITESFKKYRIQKMSGSKKASQRSEERSVGKESVGPFRSRVAPTH